MERRPSLEEHRDLTSHARRVVGDLAADGQLDLHFAGQRVAAEGRLVVVRIVVEAIGLVRVLEREAVEVEGVGAEGEPLARGARREMLRG